MCFAEATFDSIKILILYFLYSIYVAYEKLIAFVSLCLMKRCNWCLMKDLKLYLKGHAIREMFVLIPTSFEIYKPKGTHQDSHSVSVSQFS